MEKPYQPPVMDWYYDSFTMDNEKRFPSFGKTKSEECKPVKKCPFCAEEIQDEAIVCKHCGRDLKPNVTAPAKADAKPKGILAGLLVLLVSFVACVAFFSAMEDSPEQKAEKEAQDKPMLAYVAAKKFVADKLVAPSTASFPYFGESGVKVADHGGGRYSVRAFVDSENKFGAKVRIQYACTIKDMGNKEWQLEGDVLMLE